MRTASSLEIIERAIVDTAHEIDASKAILFGSCGRLTQNNRSDVDVVFMKETNERFIDRPDAAMTLLHQKIQGRGIDVLIYTAHEFNKMRDEGNSFVKQIIKDGRILYGE